MSQNGDVRAAIEAVERLHEPTPLEVEAIGRGELYAIPSGVQIHDLKQFIDARRESPERRKGTAKLTSLESMIAHARRFGDADSALFAVDEPGAPKLLAVYDYHEGNRRNAEGALESIGMPRFGVHRAEYWFPMDEAWRAWTGLAKREFSQTDFAQWLEDRAGDVMDPAVPASSVVQWAKDHHVTLAYAAELITLSRSLSVRVDSKVTQAVNLTSGEASIGFEESHRDKDGGPVKVPGGFAIAIPVFRGGSPYAIGVRLRYRVHAGVVHWRLLPHRVDRVFDDAFRGACESAAEATGLPLFYGSPEA